MECFDTGLETNTSGRVGRAAELVAGGTFCLTYANGVGDVDLAAQAELHRAEAATATMTVVRPRSQWGVASIDADGRVRGFEEKPRLDHWVNGGFFRLEPAFLDYVNEASLLRAGPARAPRCEGSSRRLPPPRLLGLAWTHTRTPWSSTTSGPGITLRGRRGS